MNKTWTKEREQQLRELREEPLSRTEIANLMGLSSKVVSRKIDSLLKRGDLPKLREPGGEQWKFVHKCATYDKTNACCGRSQTNRSDYAQLTHVGKHYLAHRLMCQLAHGYPERRSRALHTCANRDCVNPKHLFWKETRT